MKVSEPSLCNARYRSHISPRNRRKRQKKQLVYAIIVFFLLLFCRLSLPVYGARRLTVDLLKLLPTSFYFFQYSLSLTYNYGKLVRTSGRNQINSAASQIKTFAGKKKLRKNETCSVNKVCLSGKQHIRIKLDFV